MKTFISVFSLQVTDLETDTGRKEDAYCPEAPDAFMNKIGNVDPL